MKVTPRIIACAFIDAIEKSPEEADSICDATIALLKQHCPSVHLRDFVKVTEKEVKRRGDVSGGMLVVPHEKSMSTEVIAKQLEKASGKTIELDRKIDPELIGGAVLLIDHIRIDSSVQGALQALLRECLQPLD